MKITRTSILTKRVHEREIATSPKAMAAYEKGDQLLQDVFSDLDKSDREFIKTGITEEEWNEIFGDEDEEPENEDEG